MKYLIPFLFLLTLISCEEEAPVDPFAISEKSRDSIYLKVQELYTSNKYTDAEKLLSTIRARDMYDHPYFYHNAKVKMSLNKNSEAIHFLNSALKATRDIKNASAIYYLKSTCFVSLGLNDSALIALNKSIELDSTNEGYISVRARLYGSMNIPTLRYDDIKHLIRIDSNNVDYQMALNESKFDFGDTLGSIAGMNELLKKFPENVFVLFKKGQLDYILNKNAEAKKYFQKCIDIDPTHGEVFFYMASILSNENKKDKACDCLLKAVELGNSDASKHIYKCADYLKKKGIQLRTMPDTTNASAPAQRSSEI